METRLEQLHRKERERKKAQISTLKKINVEG
jgi:hypothetical protein